MQTSEPSGGKREPLPTIQFLLRSLRSARIEGPFRSRPAVRVFGGEWQGGDFNHRLDVPLFQVGLPPVLASSRLPSAAPSSSRLPCLPS